MKSIITIDKIDDVNISTAIINHNDANNYLKILGNYSGDVILTDVEITNNNQNAEYFNSTDDLIFFNGFENAIIDTVVLLLIKKEILYSWAILMEILTFNPYKSPIIH